MKKMNRRTFTATFTLGLGFANSLPSACAVTEGKNEKQLGIALVGLGSYSEYQLAPSLQETTHCR